MNPKVFTLKVLERRNGRQDSNAFFISCPYGQLQMLSEMMLPAKPKEYVGKLSAAHAAVAMVDLALPSETPRPIVSRNRVKLASYDIATSIWSTLAAEDLQGQGGGVGRAFAHPSALAKGNKMLKRAGNIPC